MRKSAASGTLAISASLPAAVGADPARRRALQAVALPLIAPWMPALAAASGEPGRAARDQRPQRAGDGASVHALSWHDSARDRTLPLRLRLPGGDAATALVLFSHGLGGSVEAGTQWAQAWAAAGIGTLHLQHPGSDRDALRTGVATGAAAAADGLQLVQRAADVRFVLDEIERRRRAGEAPWSRLDPQALGLAGHSFGAHTALAVAGQRFGARGAALEDVRPRAFAAFSPAPPRSGDADEAFAGITRPVLCLTGTLDGDPLAPLARRGSRAGQGGTGRGEPDAAAVPTPSGRRSADDGRWRRAVHGALPVGDKAELWLDGADHMTFSGHVAEDLPRARRRSAAAQAGAPRHEALVAHVSTLWWRAQLLGDAAARDALRRPPEGLVAGDEWLRG